MTKKWEFKLRGQCDFCSSVDFLHCAIQYGKWACDKCNSKITLEKNPLQFEIVAISTVMRGRRFSENSYIVLQLADILRDLPQNKAVKISTMTVPRNGDNLKQKRNKNQRLIYKAGMLANRKVCARYDVDGIMIVTCKK